MFQQLLQVPGLTRPLAANTLHSWKRHRATLWKQGKWETGVQATERKKWLVAITRHGLHTLLDYCSSWHWQLSWSFVCSVLGRCLQWTRWSTVLLAPVLIIALEPARWDGARQSQVHSVSSNTYQSKAAGSKLHSVAEGRLEATSQGAVFGVWGCCKSWVAGCVIDKACNQAFKLAAHTLFKNSCHE